MKRSKRDRLEKTILTNLHNSKYAFNPEQCNSKFREDLSEIDQEYSVWNSGNFTRVYESPILDELNERMYCGLERYKGRLIWDKFQPRRNRDCESFQNYDDRTRFKQSADRRDYRSGVYDPLDFKPSKYNSNKHLTQQGLDDYYEPPVIDFYDDLDCDCDNGYDDYEISLEEFAEIDEFNDETICDEWYDRHIYDESSLINHEYRVHCEYEQGFEEISDETHIVIKQSLCPEDGKFVENEEIISPVFLPWIKRAIPMLLTPFVKSINCG